jgi:hypothetical protein
VATAEKCIIEDKYDEAAKNYRKAFKNKDFMFDSDLINAIYCEIMSKNPSKEYCRLYSEQYGYDLYEYYKDFKNVDSTFFVKPVRQKFDASLLAKIRQMGERDQSHRMKYNPKDTLQNMQMLYDDFYNFKIFSKLLDSVNLFDERIMRFDEISIFFNHWSINSFSVTDFLPKMQKAIDEGVMDARNFASDIGDILFWRKDAKNPFSPYGTSMLTIYNLSCENRDASQSRFLAFFNFDKNDKATKKKIKEIDKKRKSIYLGGAEESNIMRFKFWIKIYTNQNLFEYLQPTAISDICSNNAKNILDKKLSENPNFDYYLTGEHDFNSK